MGFKSLFRLGLISLAVTIILSGCSLTSTQQSTAPVLLKPVKMKTRTVEAKRGTIVLQLNGVAIVTPVDSEFSHFLHGGTLERVHVHRGDLVKEGELLIELNKGNLKLQIAQQELNLEKARSKLNQSKSSQDAEQVKIQVMNYQIEQMKLDSLRDSLASKSMYAARDGLITFMETMKHGDPVYAYQDIVGITDPRKFTLTYVAEKSDEIFDVSVGMDVMLQANGKTFSGKVSQTPSTAPFVFNLDQDQATLRSKTVLIDSQEFPSNTQLGDKIQFTIDLDKKEDVVIIPRAALNQYQGRSFVYVLDGESRKEISVSRGMMTSTEVEIDSGLKEGQQVVISN